MQYKIGKIKDYNGQTGEIVSDNDIYMFLNSDIIDDDVIENNDMVKFRDEVVDNNKRAFFVKKLTRNFSK